MGRYIFHREIFTQIVQLVLDHPPRSHLIIKQKKIQILDRAKKNEISYFFHLFSRGGTKIYLDPQLKKSSRDETVALILPS